MADQQRTYFCIRCNESLPADRFYPSSIRHSIRTCRMHLNTAHSVAAARRATREAETLKRAKEAVNKV